MPALDDDDLLAAGQVAGVLELADGADRRVAPADLRQQHDLPAVKVGGGDRGLCLGRVELDGDVHVRQDDPRGQGQDRQLLSYF